MNTGGERIKVGISLAADDTRMRLITAVQALVVAPVKSEHRPSFSRRVSKDLGIYAAGSTHLLHRSNVMPVFSQALDDTVMKILVGVQAPHSNLPLGILTDCVLDLFSM
jgi:hypothetical protein